MSNLLLIIIIIIICINIIFNCTPNKETFDFTSAFDNTDFSKDNVKLCIKKCNPVDERCIDNCLIPTF
jgi:hypothetical protein